MLFSSSIFGCMNESGVKYLIIFSFLVLSSNYLSCQDLIITIFQDSIHCKVDKTNDTFIYFRTKKTKGNSPDVISRKEVAELIYNFDQRSIPSRKQRDYDMFEVYGSFAVTRLLSEIPRNLPGEFSEYLNQLKWGFGFSAGTNILISENMGIGISFSQTNFENSVEVMQVGTGITGTLSDDIVLTYLGVGVVYSGVSGEGRSFFQLNAGLGYLWYSNEARTIYPYNVNSRSLGGHISTSLNFSLGSGVYVPVQIGLKGFSASSMKLSFPGDLPDEFREGITLEVENNDPAAVLRVHLSVGLLISF